MDCLNCDAENIRDYPVCESCEPACHFTNRADCRCEACQDARAVAARAGREALAEAAWQEEGQYVYGWRAHSALREERERNLTEEDRAYYDANFRG